MSLGARLPQAKHEVGGALVCRCHRVRDLDARALDPQREVEILKLVGATDPYVRRPFLIEGAAQGILGVILALILVALLYVIIHGQFDAELGALLGMRPRFLPLWLTAVLIVAGGGLGALAAFASLRKLLTV